MKLDFVANVIVNGHIVVSANSTSEARQKMTRELDKLKWKDGLFWGKNKDNQIIVGEYDLTSDVIVAEYEKERG